jgi:hypothetical protein
VAFDETELRRIDRHVGGLCRDRQQPGYRDHLEFIYENSGHNVSIYEVRPGWGDPSAKTKMGIARFKFIRSKGEWRLYWMRRELKWHRYDEAGATGADLKRLVQIVAEDRWCAFFS